MPMAKAQSDGICLRCESNRFKVNEIRFISNWAQAKIDSNRIPMNMILLRASCAD